MSSTVAATLPDPRACERARLTRDARFDGLFYTAVASTGIYCRPVCPAPPARAENVRYFRTAAAAAAAGFRPCLRCRPEAAPGSPLHHAASALVAAALRLIDEGLLDRAPASALAARLGIGERHLRRLFADELGASPNQVAANRRLLLAKRLLDEGELSITRIAEAAGYASLRRFNTAFRAAWGASPRALRERRRKPVGDAVPTALSLRLPYRAPFDFAQLLDFAARRAIRGVEVVAGGSYQRSFVFEGEPGWFSVASDAGADQLRLRIQHPRAAALGLVAARVRRMFDLDADPVAIRAALGRDARIGPLIRRWPGQRLPGCWDGFEMAVRAILGQQVSVAAASTLAARIAERFGEPFSADAEPALTRLSPAPAALAGAALEDCGVMPVRAAAIRALATAVREDKVDFSGAQPAAALRQALLALPGIGAWTADYLAMRAQADPDAFPAGDLILRRAAGDGATLTARALEAMSAAWRPWRAYAVMLLWRSS